MIPLVINAHRTKTANMSTRSLWVAMLAAAIAYAATAVSLQEKKPPGREYVGSKRCRLCHNSPLRGNIYEIWSKNRHAGAYRTLFTSEAKKVVTKLGVGKPEKSGDCLRCHATAYGYGKKIVTKKVKIEEGVGCESCHGAGKDFSKLSIMKDREKAVAAGLVYPAKNVCTKCHNPESPTWDPERYTDKKGKKTGFDFDVLWEMVEHHMPKK